MVPVCSGVRSGISGYTSNRYLSILSSAIPGSGEQPEFDPPDLDDYADSDNDEEEVTAAAQEDQTALGSAPPMSSTLTQVHQSCPMLDVRTCTALVYHS